MFIMNKYIICDSARANWGKSTTLLEVANLFECNPNFKVLRKTFVGTDQWLVVTDGKKTYLIQTQGDYAKCFDKTLSFLQDGGNADIIICACHTRGESRAQLNEIAHSYHFTQIFFNNFSPLFNKWIPEINNANKLIAKSVYELALSL